MPERLKMSRFLPFLAFPHRFRRSHTIKKAKSVTFSRFELDKFQKRFCKSYYKYSRSGRVSLTVFLLLAVQCRFRQPHAIKEAKTVTFLIFKLEKFQRQFWKSCFKRSRSGRPCFIIGFTVFGSHTPFLAVPHC